MENTVRYKPEVEALSQTRSTSDSVTETDIDTMSIAIPVFVFVFFFGGGASFSLVYNANLTRRFLHAEIPNLRTDTGSSYNLATAMF